MNATVMLQNVRGFVQGSWVGLTYGSILLGTAIWSTTMSAAQWDAVTQTISTNLTNMASEPFIPLVLSASVVDGSLLFWIPIMVALFVVMQRWVGAGWTVAFALLGNAVPTLVTVVSINIGLTLGWYNDSIRTTLDFGVSYIYATFLGILIWRIPSTAWRVAYLGLSVISLYGLGVAGLPQNFTALGHLTAFVFGVALGAFVVKYLHRSTVSTPAVQS